MTQGGCQQRFGSASGFANAGRKVVFTNRGFDIEREFGDKLFLRLINGMWCFDCRAVLQHIRGTFADLVKFCQRPGLKLAFRLYGRQTKTKVTMANSYWLKLLRGEWGVRG